jgi:hypothetical protein
MIVKTHTYVPVSFEIGNDTVLVVDREGVDMFSIRVIRTTKVNGKNKKEEIPCDFELSAIPGSEGSFMMTAHVPKVY